MVRVLKALLARACIPFCLLQVLRFESDQLLYTDIIFLCIWITFTTACIFDALDAIHVEGALIKFVKECCIILCMIFSYICIHQLFMERSDMRRHFLTDHGFPYMNFKQVFNWICFEMWTFSLTLYHYLTARGLMRPLRLISYLIHLLINAIVFTCIVEMVFSSFFAFIIFSMYDSFHFTFDVNNTNAYPYGYLSPEMIDRKLYDKSTVHSQWFSCHPYVVEVPGSTRDVHMTCTQPFSINYFENETFPLEQHSIYRYLGEDVKMRCNFYKKDNVEIKHSTATVWYLNETMVANSSRHNIENTYYEIGEWQQLSSVLTIKRLKHSDFGEYRCMDTTKITQLKQEKFMEFHEYHEIHKYTVNVFNLNLLKMQTKILHKIVGNLITSEYFFLYHTDDDLSDISLRYTINDRPVEEVCPGFQTKVCSVGASVMRYIIRISTGNFAWNGVEFYPFLDVRDYFSGMKRGIFYFCLCSDGFGVHKISYLRHVHKMTAKRQTIEEFLHPFVFIVLPLSTVSLFRMVDDSHLYQRIEKLVEEETDVDVIEYEVQQHFLFIAANEEKVFTFANLIQNLLFLISIVCTYIAVIILGTIYYNVFIVMPARLYYLRPALPEVPRVFAIEEETFDVFLSYADEEYGFVSQTIVPFLEGDCNLRVSLANRDISPNRSIFSSYVENIGKCKKVIVILSKAYLAEPRCIKLQLEHIILPLYYDHSIAPHDILLLRYDEGRLPDMCRWNFDIDVLPWIKITQLPEPVLLQKVKLWLLTGRVNINCHR